MIEIFDLAIYHQEGSHRTAWFPGQSLADAPEEVVVAAADLWIPEAVDQWRQEHEGDPLPMPPAYAAAWADLITSPLYQRALGLAFAHLGVNTAMTTFGIAFQAHRDLPHDVWAGALTAATGHLATAINATDEPLTMEEQQWVERWNEAHHLGLTINWEAGNV